MEHDDLVAAMNRESLAAGAEIVDCLRGCAALHRSGRLAVVSIEAVDARALEGAAAGCTMYRLREPAAAATAASFDPWLPFDDGAFDAVVLYRVTSRRVDIDLLLGEAGRVLRPDGHVVVVEHETDFAFAPLPEAGPAHLLHGWLKHAGFSHVDLAERAGARVVAVAH